MEKTKTVMLGWKTHILFWTCVLMGIMSFGNGCPAEASESERGIKIDNVNFPDDNFRGLLDSYDDDRNGYFSDTEIKKITSLSIQSKNISSLEGIKYLTGLENLECSYNNIKNLDVSGLKSLKYLECGNNGMEKLNVSGLENMIYLWCNDNNLTTLSLTGLGKLQSVDCSNNKIPSLNLNGLDSLISLECRSNGIKQLQLSNLKKLILLDCTDNNIETLNTKELGHLTDLWCANNSLSVLELTELKDLVYLSCGYNNISYLDLSNQSNLEYLEFDENPIYAVNMADNSLKITSVSKSYYADSNNLDIGKIPGLNTGRISNMKGGRISNNKIIFDSNVVTYDYDMRNGSKSTFSIALAGKSSLSANMSTNVSSLTEGGKITLSVAATGGNGGYFYRYAVLNTNTGTWTVLKDFSHSSKYTYVVDDSGTLQYSATVKDSKGNTVATNRGTVNVAKKADALTAKLTVDGSTDRVTKAVGTKITFNIAATGGKGGYTYRYTVMNADTGVWTILKDFDSVSSYTYTLNYTGTKQFAATVKDASGKTVAANRITVNVVKNSQPLSGKLTVNNLTNKLKRSVGTTITLDAAGTGGSGTYTYRFAVLDTDTGKWTVLKDFSSESSCEYTFSYAGNVQFAVTVKDSTGATVAANRITVKVV